MCYDIGLGPENVTYNCSEFGCERKSSIDEGKNGSGERSGGVEEGVEVTRSCQGK